MTTYSNLQTIQGKWHQRSYQIEKELGQGATGKVYLVRFQGSTYALKMGKDSFSIAAEVNVLKQFSKAQGGILGPSVVDVDDWETGAEIRPFYVMNVIQGASLHRFITERGPEWVPVLILQLLTFLEALHEKGWVFGDLKPDNLKVVGQPPKIAWYDAGGMTKFGRSVKEYTEWYDRGYWNMGNRKAEPSYDLFSVSMIMLELMLKSRPEPQEQPRLQLKEIIFQSGQIFPYQKVLWEAIEGKYGTATQMKQELLRSWQLQTGASIQQNGIQSVRRTKKRKKKSGWGQVLWVLFFSSFFLFIFALYLYTSV